MADYPSINRIANLQQFIADLAKIERLIPLADTGRPENDLEHSYGLALTCWFLAPKIAPELDLSKIFSYALAHDTVEIHAGDTYVFATDAELDSKSAREDASLVTMSNDWPDFPELIDYATGYKNKRDEEAKFVYAIDKILPILMIDLGERGNYWQRNEITYEMLRNQKQTILKSTIIAPYYQKLLDYISAPGFFEKPNK